MKKIILLAIFLLTTSAWAANSVLEEKFNSTNELKKQWTLSQNGKFIVCTNGTLTISAKDKPTYRYISLRKKERPLKDFIFSIDITPLNDNGWCGIYLDGINFLIRRGGFNYTYRTEVTPGRINKVIPAKIIPDNTYKVKIISKIVNNGINYQWFINGKEIAQIFESSNIIRNGFLRLGSLGMGVKFSRLNLAKCTISKKSSNNARDMTLENTTTIEAVADTRINKNSPVNYSAVLAQKSKLGLKKFPIGAYMNSFQLNSPYAKSTFSGDKEIKDWEEIGFTLVMSQEFNSENSEQRDLMGVILNNASKHGIKMLLYDRSIYNNYKITKNEFTKRIIKAGDFFSKFDSFSGFMVVDEPSEKNLQKSLDLVKIHRKVLPGKIPFINFGFEPANVGKKSWDDFFSSVINEGHLEVLSYDFYGQMLDKEKLSSYYFMILGNLRASSVKNGVPFWFIGLVTPHLYFIEPDFNDLRWQFNTAICYGASGFFWWFYYDVPHGLSANYRNSPVDWNGDKTANWYNLKRIHQKFHNQYGNLFNRLASLRVTHYPSFAGCQKWTPNEILLDIEVDARGIKNSKKHKIIIGEFIDSKERKYIMLVNNSRVDSVALRLKFPDNAILYNFNNGIEHKGYSPEYGIGKHWLAPGQEVLYRVELTKK